MKPLAQLMAYYRNQRELIVYTTIKDKFDIDWNTKGVQEKILCSVGNLNRGVSVSISDKFKWLADNVTDRIL